MVDIIYVHWSSSTIGKKVVANPLRRANYFASIVERMHILKDKRIIVSKTTKISNVKETHCKRIIKVEREALMGLELHHTKLYE